MSNLENRASGKRRFEFTSAGLHVLAMLLMLCDHLWYAVIPGNDWMTCIGRIAFPVFAFMIAEGCFYTRSLKRYARRLFLFAIVSEIPFNLMCGGGLFYPLHQNVLWTFWLGVCAIAINEKARKTGKLSLRIAAAAGTVMLGDVLGFLLMTDYYGAGVLMVLAFYFFRGRKWWCCLGQAAALVYLNAFVLRGFSYVVEIFGTEILVPRQALAILALIPIWMYRGKQGYHEKWFRYFCYWFYPAHLLAMHLLRLM